LVALTAKVQSLTFGTKINIFCWASEFRRGKAYHSNSFVLSLGLVVVTENNAKQQTRKQKVVSLRSSLPASIDSFDYGYPMAS
jgi:hypothetical protein